MNINFVELPLNCFLILIASHGVEHLRIFRFRRFEKTRRSSKIRFNALKLNYSSVSISPDKTRESVRYFRHAAVLTIIPRKSCLSNLKSGFTRFRSAALIELCLKMLPAQSVESFAFRDRRRNRNEIQIEAGVKQGARDTEALRAGAVILTYDEQGGQRKNTERWGNWETRKVEISRRIDKTRPRDLDIYCASIHHLF